MQNLVKQKAYVLCHGCKFWGLTCAVMIRQSHGLSKTWGLRILELHTKSDNIFQQRRSYHPQQGPQYHSIVKYQDGVYVTNHFTIHYIKWKYSPIRAITACAQIFMALSKSSAKLEMSKKTIIKIYNKCKCGHFRKIFWNKTKSFFFWNNKTVIIHLSSVWNLCGEWR